MKQSTIEKWTNTLNDYKNSGYSSLKKYCEANAIVYKGGITNTFSQLKKKENKTDAEIELLNLYNSIVHDDIVDTENYCEASYERNAEGKIIAYKYKIYKKNKPTLDGSLSREEMDKIMRLYTWYGDGLTARVVSREFPQFSLPDLKRIFKCFSIYKDNCPFSPHMVEERTIDELREIQLREKENSFLRKAEEDNIKNNEKLLKKYAQENIELRKQLNNLTNIKIKLPNVESPYKLTIKKDLNQSMNLYLSDLHIGSRVASGSIAYDNKNFSPNEVRVRLLKILEQLSQLGEFETINLVLLGDILDTCGVEGKTARLDHSMPTNLDCREQANETIEILTWFVDTIVANNLANKIRIFSVPEGNHDGVFGYVTIKAFLHLINARYPNIYTKQFEEYYGIFKQDLHQFVIAHGKDSRFMKKGQPLTLNDKTQLLIYEWLEENNIHGQNIHFIKGDLHTEAITTCKRFDYRSVMSLYGASDYSAMNFSSSGQGCSYDLIVNNQLIRGIFKV